MAEFEWDPDKNASNIAKHGIGFALAALIFDGRVLTAQDVRFEYGEPRWISIGEVGDTVVIVVVHVDRDGRTRIISARRANRKERHRYEEALQAGNDYR